MRSFWKIFSGFLSLILAISLLSSCASTTLRDTWSNPAFHGYKVHKLVVVSLGKKDPNRRVYEEVIAAELNKRGIAAVTGHNLLPAEERLDWPTLEGALKRASADSVLTVQTVRVEQQTIVQPGYTSTYPGYWYPPAFPSWSLYGYYGASMYYEPPYVSTYDLATIQVNLFDMGTGKLIWAATAQSSEPERITEVSKELADIVREQLAKAGLL
ncbi:DUF4136 domain-containing protein [Geomesophilobacter sediminis]|uniref:DUF4136 domain-containing protein n=1 Tax=Geomesophilobacter sediminis TaxID=2798584 RepID=A0A8J7JBD9_9BACT|nr:DUF4136 domain-containing protein [Geomesophilobacter sediminis]MBJ6723878.1 DUF4136 domain-containing protein [Geomesophilobacter sediminis]